MVRSYLEKEKEGYLYVVPKNRVEIPVLLMWRSNGGFNLRLGRRIETTELEWELLEWIGGLFCGRLMAAELHLTLLEENGGFNLRPGRRIEPPNCCFF